MTSAEDRIWTVPNVLSMLRLLGVPVFLWLVLGLQADGWAVLLLIVAGATDWLDGWWARTFDQTTRIGRMLDPVADRLYILATLFGLAVRDVIPWWLAVVIPLRDVLLTLPLGILRKYGYSPWQVHFLGKAATFSLLYAFPLLFLAGHDGWYAEPARILGWAFAVWGTGLYWWAGVLYVVQTHRLIRRLGEVSTTGG